MSAYSRLNTAYLIVLAALVATAVGPLDAWQRILGIAALVAAAVVLPKPWEAHR